MANGKLVLFIENYVLPLTRRLFSRCTYDTGPNSFSGLKRCVVTRRLGDFVSDDFDL
ncbi:hypothetical protein K402DRAFT_390221 [Aulographum hederae CBS 113979]|uniref:Uncharacterized protein n=1 Tax=Aulographum hederae CBS 113979 TaxID=1176131 RepID=A0A6G1HA42_9PEZI|nr:hypothetical protein K402DRAFT_390221 [Aulographum hederae CBS 113979]